MKQKLYKVEERASEFESQVAEKTILTQRLEDQVLKAKLKASKVEDAITEVKKLIDELQGKVSELSTMRSKLKRCVAKLTEEAEVASKKAIMDFMAFEAFIDEVNESALEMFYKGFNECSRQLRLLYPDLDLSKLQEELSDED